jgi:hypothetical protein
MLRPVYPGGRFGAEKQIRTWPGIVNRTVQSLYWLSYPGLRFPPRKLHECTQVALWHQAERLQLGSRNSRTRQTAFVRSTRTHFMNVTGDWRRLQWGNCYQILARLSYQAGWDRKVMRHSWREKVMHAGYWREHLNGIIALMCGTYRTANLQTLHFKYLFKYPYWIF